jgi:hypothetical protein
LGPLSDMVSEMVSELLSELLLALLCVFFCKLAKCQLVVAQRPLCSNEGHQHHFRAMSI